MGGHRKRRRREERLEEEEEQQGREPAQESCSRRSGRRSARPRAADRVLDLQKTAGNRATTAALSRWGFPWFPATAAPQWPKEPQVIIDGVVIPLAGVVVGGGPTSTARRHGAEHVAAQRRPHRDDARASTAPISR